MKCSIHTCARHNNQLTFQECEIASGNDGFRKLEFPACTGTSGRQSQPTCISKIICCQAGPFIASKSVSVFAKGSSLLDTCSFDIWSSTVDSAVIQGRIDVNRPRVQEVRLQKLNSSGASSINGLQMMSRSAEASSMGLRRYQLLGRATNLTYPTLGPDLGHGHNTFVLFPYKPLMCVAASNQGW